MSVISIFAVVFFLAVFILNFAISAFVYSDAKKRQMAPAFAWAVFVFAVPLYLGLVIYFIIRKDNGRMKCAKCSAQVEKGFVVCPSCGTKLKSVCQQCGAVLQPSWRVCPHCAAPVEYTSYSVTPPISESTNKPVWITLAAVVLVPLVFIGALIGFNALYSQNQVAEVTVSQDLLSDANDIYCDDVDEWINSCISYDMPEKTAFVYMYQDKAEEEGFYSVQCLIFIPFENKDGTIEISDTDGSEYISDSGLFNDVVYNIGIEATYIPDFIVRFNGEEYAIDKTFTSLPGYEWLDKSLE